MGKSSSTIACCWAWRGTCRARLVPGRSQSRAATRLTIPASSSMYRDLSSDPAGNSSVAVSSPKGSGDGASAMCYSSVIQRGISAHRHAHPQDPAGSAKQSGGQRHRSASGQPDGRHRAAASLWGAGLLHHLPGVGQRGPGGTFPIQLAEREMLAESGLLGRYRLACQARVLGDVVVERPHWPWLNGSDATTGEGIHRE